MFSNLLLALCPSYKYLASPMDMLISLTAEIFI